MVFAITKVFEALPRERRPEVMQRVLDILGDPELER